MTVKLPFRTDSTRFLEKDRQHALGTYQAEFCPNEIGPQQHLVFEIDQAVLRPATKKNNHWSIAWSDLMMTMFILFLSLFIYQAAHKEYLVSEKNEIIAGETTEVVETAKPGEATLPFPVLKRGAPLLAAGTIPKVESITLQDIDLETTFSKEDLTQKFDELAKSIAPPSSASEQLVSGKSAIVGGQNAPPSEEEVDSSSVNALYAKSQRTLDTYDLAEFAAINLAPNKAVRIVLTGDLLFETGHAALSENAISSLEKIANVIRTTPHQIHIEGHTDDIPIAYGRYASNWELSVARAHAVASFLIEDMQMDPSQFVISGYASYKPAVANSDASNRAKNRRVEIVVTQTPAQSTLAQTQTPDTNIKTL
ncbi:MAG: OmpA family protein [Bacteroidetes bacterium]|jgi:chemotaxis protein MotB|nr:OmpA family protein [Bacteroidota bacterium]